MACSIWPSVVTKPMWNVVLFLTLKCALSHAGDVDGKQLLLTLYTSLAGGAVRQHESYPTMLAFRNSGGSTKNMGHEAVM